jgi:AMMECR1 domain-containing protein
MKKILLPSAIMAVLAFMVISAVPLSGEDDPFNQWKGFSRSADAKKMIGWMHCSMVEFVAGSSCLQYPDFSAPLFYGRYGLFVTLVKRGKVRGCFGAFDHRSDRIDVVLKEYLHGAMRRDSRYPPLEPGETDNIHIIVTVAGSQYPVEDLEDVDIARYGIVVMFENNERAVYVPSEIKSTDALKRGLKGREISQIHAFRAVTIK